jgi:hypothetical protein
MSSAHDAHASTDHHAHDAHAFDGEPIATLPDDEPRTPGWLPLLGGAIFVAAFTAYLVSSRGPAEPPKVEEPKVAAPAATPAAPAPVAPARGGDRPAAAPSGSARRLTPEQMEQLKKRMEESRKKGAPTRKPNP